MGAITSRPDEQLYRTSRIDTLDGPLRYQAFAERDGISSLAEKLRALQVANQTPAKKIANQGIPVINPLRIMNIAELQTSGIWDITDPQPVYVDIGGLGMCTVVAVRALQSSRAVPLVEDSYSLLAVEKLAPLDPLLVTVNQVTVEVPEQMVEAMQRAIVVFRPEQDYVQVIDGDGRVSETTWTQMRDSEEEDDQAAVDSLMMDFPMARVYRTMITPGEGSSKGVASKIAQSREMDMAKVVGAPLPATSVLPQTFAQICTLNAQKTATTLLNVPLTRQLQSVQSYEAQTAARDTPSSSASAAHAQSIGTELGLGLQRPAVPDDRNVRLATIRYMQSQMVPFAEL